MNRIKTTLILGLLTVGLIGCSDSDSATNPEPTPPPQAQEFSTVLSLVVPDSNGNPRTDLTNAKADVFVTTSTTEQLVAARNSDEVRVVDGQGETITSIEIPATGIAAAALMYNEGFFEAGGIAIIDFVVSADGNYANKVTAVVDQSAVQSGTISVEAQLTSKQFDAEEEGIAIASAPEVKTSASDVSVDEEAKTAVILVPIESSTPTFSDSEELQEVNQGGKAEVSIPANTTLVAKNAAGETVPIVGALSTNVAYFSADPSNAADESLSPLNQFPGGLSPESVVGIDGGEEGGNFISAGFVAIEIADEAGNLVREFSSGNDEDAKPVQITFTVPAGTKDDEGNEVKEGSVIPFWSYDESTGQWAYEGEVTLSAANSDGNFPAVAAVDHLSYFNLDYFGQDRCNIQMTVSDSVGETSENLNFAMRRSAGGWNKYKTTYDNSPNITVVNVPPYDGTFSMNFRGVDGSAISALSLTDGSGNALPSGTVGADGVVTGLNFCGGDGERGRQVNYVVTLDATPPVRYDVPFSIVDQCTDSNLSTQQPGYIYIYENGRWVTWLYSSSTSTVSKTLEEGSYSATIYVWNVEKGYYDSFVETFSVDSDAPVVFTRNFICDPSGGTGASAGGGTGN
ncbi:hypothetical protein GT360_13370 [Vibrio astriarenae]|uniref:Uncharacterized protein n=1 Tax=Vibrio astriarenae TaxID=1481923 RepID=A0A7Z2T5A0_9VIBR|nr:hypothetical protein [Vibrio astriarenae]QIA64418.1 hypothetical protein GT360_13370 [Vibrio astriarenae]